MEKIKINFAQKILMRGTAEVAAGAIVAGTAIATKTFTDAFMLQPMLQAAKSLQDNYEATVWEFEAVRSIINRLPVDSKISFANEIERLNPGFSIVAYERGDYNTTVSNQHENSTPLPPPVQIER